MKRIASLGHRFTHAPQPNTYITIYFHLRLIPYLLFLSLNDSGPALHAYIIEVGSQVHLFG